MPFVKLDCGLLKSTLWFDHDALHIFITALLSARPHEIREPARTYPLDSTDADHFVVPPGWYGLVESSAPGLVHDALMEPGAGMLALERLRQPEAASRTPEFGGRRMVRVAGGFLILNYQKFRDKDYGAAQRMRDYRERKKQERIASLRYGEPLQRDAEPVTGDTVTVRPVTQAEAEAEAEAEEEKRIHPRRHAPFHPPTLEDVRAFASEIPGLNAEAFWNYFESTGWKRGKGPMRDWKAAARGWRLRDAEAGKIILPREKPPDDLHLRRLAEVQTEDAETERLRRLYLEVRDSDPDEAARIRERIKS